MGFDTLLQAAVASTSSVAESPKHFSWWILTQSPHAQIMVPETEAEAMDEDGPQLEEDAAEADARRKAAVKAAEEAELRKRSQVLSGPAGLAPSVASTSRCCVCRAANEGATIYSQIGRYLLESMHTMC